MGAVFDFRDIALETIQRLPKDTSREEVMYQLSLVSKVMEGLKDEQEGRLISTNELRKLMKTWQK